MQTERSILLITTGGTIDSEPYPDNESDYPALSVHNGTSRAFQALEDIIARQNEAPSYRLHHTALCAKDSKHLSSEDQDAILRQILRESAHWRIVITIGTDRMINIARNLRTQVQNSAFRLPCPVVFTGAIWPLSNGTKKSDGFDNLALATLSYPNLSPDIYVAMHSIMATPDQIEKDFVARTFIRIDP